MSLATAFISRRPTTGPGGEALGRIRAATPADLPRLNSVIARAIETWRVADRVKRISLPLCQYLPDDLAYFEILLAETPGGEIVGIAAVEPDAAAGTNPDSAGMTLHGIYVDPAHQRGGVGSRLLQRVESRLVERGCRGLLVKAQADAAGFFAARGFTRLPVLDAARDYPNRYWKHL